MTSSASSATTSSEPARSLRVLDGGPLTTVQDRGRFGHAHLGVPRAGALDPDAAALANRLVGNGADSAVLETSVTGPTFEVSVAMAIAVTGARCEIRVDGRAAPWGEALSLPAGARVSVGSALDGVRSYVAVAGGIEVEPVLGSRSTDTLAWVGPPRVVSGAVLPVGAPAGEPAPAAAVPARTRHIVLRYDAGPRADWFDDVPDGSYRVLPESNRIGLRLSGRPLLPSRRDELPSEGIVLGAIQVPADGQPLVFLNDHPTTGGYPVVGVVAAEDVPLCAQLRPGDAVTLRPR